LQFRRLPILAFVLLITLLLGCSGGKEEKFPNVQVLKQGEVVPVIANSEITVGRNRMAFGVLDRDGSPIVDANVHLAFYEITDGQAQKRFETDAQARVPARDAGLQEQVIHQHADGSRHAHVNAGDDVGVYTAVVDFPRPGDWGVEMQVESSKVKATLRPRFNVIPQGPTPAVGSPAPRSRNRTAADVTDLSLLDSSASPSRELHTMTIADAIASGRPTLVLFAVPGFCSSRLCGPELEIMRKLLPAYQEKVNFIHVEFYENPASSDRIPVETVREWNLSTEPWFFLIGSDGNIAARFEGPTSLEELDLALKEVLR
jgi:hypothetical protein